MKVVRVPTVRIAVYSLASLLMCISGTNAQVTYDTIFLEDDPAPVFSNAVTLVGFRDPFISNDGRLGFTCDLDGDSVGFFNSTAGITVDSFPEIFVQESSNGPGSVVEIIKVLVAENGSTLATVLADDFPIEYSIFLAGQDGAVLVVTENEPVAALPGITLNDISMPIQPLLSSNGRTAFFASLFGEKIDDTNNSGVFRVSSEELELLAQKGEVAPGPNTNFVFRDFVEVNAINSNDEIVLVAELQDSLEGTDIDFGVFSDVGGVLSLSLIHI